MKYSLIFAFLICLPNWAYSFDFKPVVTDIEQPTDMLFLSADNQKLLIAEKTGRLLIADLSDQTQHTVHNFAVRTKSEQGVLGITLHPDFISNHYLYVNYNPKEGERRTRISRFTFIINGNTGALSAEKVLLEVEQPYPNHNAGQIAFGPDGYLYIGMGDGGAGGDPKGHGQNLQTLLGNILRVDVNSPDSKSYNIPNDNPFVGNPAALDEIWAYGIRNPWRFSFHGDNLILADVGQNELEEVNLIEKGQNYGWKVMEGHKCFKDKAQSCDKSKYVQPFLTYGRDDGQSITGGWVYTRGSVKALRNRYVYADYISGKIWSVKFPSFTDNKLEIDTDMFISTFALDNAGELYFADYVKGKIMRVVE